MRYQPHQTMSGLICDSGNSRQINYLNNPITSSRRIHINHMKEKIAPHNWWKIQATEITPYFTTDLVLLCHGTFPHVKKIIDSTQKSEQCFKILFKSKKKRLLFYHAICFVPFWLLSLLVFSICDDDEYLCLCYVRFQERYRVNTVTFYYGFMSSNVFSSLVFINSI